MAQTNTQSAAPKKPKKKKPKPAPVATEPPVETPPPTPTPPPAEPTPPPPAPAASAPPPAEAAAPEGDLAPITDVTEKPAKTYYFVGLRYRGTIIPKFMVNMFVEEGTTVFTNTIGAEIDIRRDEFSMIPWLVYSSYSTGDMLFRSKGDDASLAQNYSDVKSSLQAIYVGADVLWSKRISKNIEFEYGAGFGVGFLFGSLSNSWVYDDAGGALVGANGNHFTQCPAGSDGITPSPSNPNYHLSCTSPGHKGGTPKVGGYSEKNWFTGGSVPTIFPHLALPELGLRFKPIKQMEARLSIGFALTGFFFGLSADYGLESREKPEAPATH